jgi:hypothetical protein
MKDKFHSSRTRIRWAKEDILHFKKRMLAFFKTKPYARVVEPHDNGIQEVHKIKLIRPLPEALTSRTIKAAEDLRSALDMAAYAIAEAVGGPALERNDIYFPFSRGETDLKSRVNRVCKYFPEEIKALFTKLQPYKGGDDLLWALNELCKPSKHKIIVPVGTSSGEMRLTRAIMTSGTAGGGYISLSKWDSEKDEMVIGAVGIGGKFEYDFNVAFNITFGEVEIVKGQPVAGVLDALAGKVSGIVDATEAEARRIGLI